MKCIVCGRECIYSNEEPDLWKRVPSSDPYKPWITDRNGDVIGVCPDCLMASGGDTNV